MQNDKYDNITAKIIWKPVNLNFPAASSRKKVMYVKITERFWLVWKQDGCYQKRIDEIETEIDQSK